MLGRRVTATLLGRGLRVRVITRETSRAAALAELGAEVVQGDVRDEDSLRRGVAGAATVISAVHGFASPGETPASVDRDGNRALIAAATGAGVAHFVLLSIHDARPDHPLELFRMKAAAEAELRASGLAWTIVRPTAYAELFIELLGLRSGSARVFGRGDNEVNFVSVVDVARFVELAVVDPTARGSVFEVGGPENVSFNEIVRRYERIAGQRCATRHVPLPALRALALLLRPMRPSLAQQITSAVRMDTADMSFDASELRRRYPQIVSTSVMEILTSLPGTTRIS